MRTKEQVMEFIQKQRVAFIASIDEEGFPNMKAMYAPRKAEENCFLLYDQYLVHALTAVYEKSKSQHLFL